MSKLPSIRTLESAFPGKGKTLRAILENAATVRAHPAAVRRMAECWNHPELSDLRMEALNAELAGHGVEYIAPGHNARSPGFHYVNMGDTYNVTIIRLDCGRYLVSDWGAIVERGRYD